jgi:DNA-directed RNA polymerase specialized sigma24 family protein
LGTLRALERKAAELTDDDVRSYLLRAVANQASKEIRRRKRKPVAPLEAAGGVAAASDSLYEQAEAMESRSLTRDLLASLPPRRRAVMLLRYGWELEPGEICGMVKDLSPRAYRKEITRGIDDLVERIKLVEEGRWCEDREPLLKALAAGTATEDQAIQAESHISHCRSCHEFVGKLTGHLHDLGSTILLPGALEAADGHSALLEKARDAIDGARDTTTGALSRSETSDGILAITGARGAGAGGLGILAKLSALGTGTKAALACAGGVVAISSCVAAGVGPISLSASSGERLEKGGRNSPPLAEVASDVRPSAAPQTAGSEAPEPPTDAGREGSQSAAAKPSPPEEVLAPETPPTTQELGVESVAQPTGSPPVQTDPSSDAGAIAGEFAP